VAGSVSPAASNLESPRKGGVAMPDVNDLAGRIDAEFAALEQKHRKIQVEQVQVYRERQKRLHQLGQVFDRLRDVWGPRLDLLVEKFKDRVKVTPRMVPSTREATFAFQSKVARVELRLSATTDCDVTKIILSYDLEIIPALIQFDAHSQVELPLDAVDTEVVARWIDDRLVSFVKTYLMLHDNEYQFKDEMVEDPVAGVRFPNFAAGATLEWEGRTYYFVGEETRSEFAQQNGIALR
jgi:YHS domain-containing protein